MVKKKFINKKKCATFQLRPRDTANPNYSAESGSDFVFVRVDTNDFSVDSFADWENVDSCRESGFNAESSIFADAIDDTDGENEVEVFDCGDVKLDLDAGSDPGGRGFPEEVRQEILELGLPDDGYNYMIHLREIKKLGSGSVFYTNCKAKMSGLPFDIKAFDASRLNLPATGVLNPSEAPICHVADRTTCVRLQKAVDPDVAALLLSDNSDSEELDEDFVLLANTSDISEPQPLMIRPEYVPEPWAPVGPTTFLDERLDQLVLDEYASDSEELAVVIGEGSVAEKLEEAFRHRPEEDVAETEVVEYRAPADILEEGERRRDGAGVEYASAVLRVCAEYAERYGDGGEDEMVVVTEESSDGSSEEWDCETVVSTYSNLDNHPGKIDAPEGGRRRRKPVGEEVLKTDEPRSIILSGKHLLPTEFLPRGRTKVGKVKKREGGERMEEILRRRDGETTEQKKERKAAVKSWRREARHTKKEMKNLYLSEAQLTRKVIASLPPPSIHIH